MQIILARRKRRLTAIKCTLLAAGSNHIIHGCSHRKHFERKQCRRKGNKTKFRHYNSTPSQSASRENFPRIFFDFSFSILPPPKMASAWIASSSKINRFGIISSLFFPIFFNIHKSFFRDIFFFLSVEVFELLFSSRLPADFLRIRFEYDYKAISVLMFKIWFYVHVSSLNHK